MASWVATSYLVSKTPFVIVAEPETPDSLAAQLLWASSAMTGPGPMPPGEAQLVVPTSSPSQRTGTGVACNPMSAELVADPPGPVVPSVATLKGPERAGADPSGGKMPLKMAAGP
jgi:hypothetical protein